MLSLCVYIGQAMLRSPRMRTSPMRIASSLQTRSASVPTPGQEPLPAPAPVEAPVTPDPPAQEPPAEVPPERDPSPATPPIEDPPLPGT